MRDDLPHIQALGLTNWSVLNRMAANRAGSALGPPSPAAGASLAPQQGALAGVDSGVDSSLRRPTAAPGAANPLPPKSPPPAPPPPPLPVQPPAQSTPEPDYSQEVDAYRTWAMRFPDAPKFVPARDWQRIPPDFKHMPPASQDGAYNLITLHHTGSEGTPEEVEAYDGAMRLRYTECCAN